MPTSRLSEMGMMVLPVWQIVSDPPMLMLAMIFAMAFFVGYTLG